MTKIIESIRNRIASYNLGLPQQIVLVKTTGKEEGDAAYCRHDDVIVLPRSKLRGPSARLEHTFIHELFHILSRNNPGLRDSLYEIVGFNPCSKIELPESLRPRRLTNPDAPVIEHYMEVTVEGQTVPVAPVLYSNEDTYEVALGKSFFAYLTFRLMAVERTGDRWQPAYRENEPWLLQPSEVSGFYEQIGRNTTYTIHPEEVLAENFVLLLNARRDTPSPEIINQMREILLKQ